MIEINSLIIMIILRIYKQDFSKQKKIFLLRLCMILRFFIRYFYFQLNKKKQNGKTLLFEGRYDFLEANYFKQFKQFFYKFLFHFISGTYPIGIIYFSLTREIIGLPFFISGL